jgi:hypothetical protein
MQLGKLGLGEPAFSKAQREPLSASIQKIFFAIREVERSNGA